ncbi:hypothetical protein Aab01nite_65820 [Paractinoplanes abujensis]|uniref:Bulb-type lectin domain-containing protein n=1 Tax=Paractinoplanes abujensis TaxID=882441 RepID=A0A7W7CT65_9ACTN|nr:hypothetical protein [Actinoplanes abujensis]MBB4692511.1 hypothetical protein [Actinoplanes abujensis]GID22992.1 hypothetical protein Aab01nite_65820 [Actinoplanes abujensis]
MRPERILAGVAALAAVLGLAAVTLPAGAETAAAPSAGVAAAADPYVFSRADVGFSEGAATTGLVGRLDAMDAYAGDRKPVLRLDLDWWGVQDCATCAPDFGRLDPIVDAANARDMRVLLILGYAPPWANGGHAGDKWFPVADTTWRSIVDATVTHFAGRVQAYEVWNEPNLTDKANYGDGSAAARRLRYWQLTKIAYEQVQVRCASCTVLAGASGGAGGADEPAAWLDWAYANGYGKTFHAVTHHPYPAWSNGRSPSRPECANRWWAMFGPPDEKCGELAAVRAVMVKRGDGSKKIWGTEYGYPSNVVPAADRRDHLEEGVRMWRALDYTGPLFVYSYADSPSCAAGSADPECHFGLTDTAGRPQQPAYDAVKLALTDSFQRTLAPGRSLHRQSALRSSDGRFQLWLQGDGNLVLYLGSTVLWSKTGLKAIRLTNQNDGSLALFDGAGTKVWSTPTAGRGPSDLNLQNDGNLVLYPRSTPLTASWSTGTWGHKA